MTNTPEYHRSLGAGVLMVTALALLGTRAAASPQEDELVLDPAEVRAAAQAEGLRPLSEVEIPEPDNLGAFLKPGEGSRQAAIALGKALFWDMQVGSDGQACASCHFHAGADSRTKNQLSPGLKNEDPLLQGLFDPTASGAAGGPNYELTEEDFPFHQLLDPEDEDYSARVVLFDTDDVASSAGVFGATFEGAPLGSAFDAGTPIADGTFSIDGVNTRRVEPRNTPTMINAVFNFANFWDGRAHNVFNGVTPLGPLDEEAVIYVRQGSLMIPQRARIPNSSLASQAVGPPLSDVEMSFFDRTFPEVARKLLHLQPLALQIVHPEDSVLGALSAAPLGGNGLTVTYAELIREAFRPRLWNSRAQRDGYSQMELNFSLFLGLSIQLYEATLVSDQSRFDQFMAGDDEALEQEELRGLLTFIRRPASVGEVFTEEIGVGNCIACHGGTEFTDAAFSSLAEDDEDELELIEVEETTELLAGFLIVGEETAYLDNGFSNIGVRPTSEDLGRGGMEGGRPLSFVRQALLGLPYAPEIPECGGVDEEECPEDARDLVDGAFKVPGLRNVELTGPYFHNGGQASLEEVVEFYDRGGDFGDVNVAELDRNMARIAIGDDDEEPLIEFLLTLTDERVRWEQGPFDHPGLLVSNGHVGDHMLLECADGALACDDVLVIPPVGAGGRLAEGLEALEPFLGIDHLEEEDDEE